MLLLKIRYVLKEILIIVVVIKGKGLSGLGRTTRYRRYLRNKIGRLAD